MPCQMALLHECRLARCSAGETLLLGVLDGTPLAACSSVALTLTEAPPEPATGLTFCSTVRLSCGITQIHKLRICSGSGVEWEGAEGLLGVRRACSMSGVKKVCCRMGHRTSPGSDSELPDANDGVNQLQAGSCQCGGAGHKSVRRRSTHMHAT